MDMAQPEYVFHLVEDQRELERLRAIEQVFDPSSRRRLLATGLRGGWSCLEVGPGAGSILNWMSSVVGPTGRVVASDLSTKFLTAAQPEQAWRRGRRCAIDAVARIVFRPGACALCDDSSA